MIALQPERRKQQKREDRPTAVPPRRLPASRLFEHNRHSDACGTCLPDPAKLSRILSTAAFPGIRPDAVNAPASGQHLQKLQAAIVAHLG